MERYHILKLGLAITFYAAYCIRPMLVYSLEADNELDNNPSVPNPDHEYFQYFQGVEGRPGIDFPVYSYIPRTAFNCRGIESGYYADLDTDCQVFHICEEGKKISFLCPNGTIFQQSELICEWWNKVNCTNSPSLYEESAERLQNDNARRKAARKVPPSFNGAATNHGAIMRMEERSSVRATKNDRDYPTRQDKQREQRIKNHRIPDNNDIEQQIEQAESNNRYLANAQNGLASSQRKNYANQQQKYPNHNYNVVDENAKTSAHGSRSKQTKKDIDKVTGNYINNNYDQPTTRQSKKIDQGIKNSYDFGTKTTLKEYHVQFGSTDSVTESYQSTQNFRQFGSTSSNSRSSNFYSTQSIAAQNDESFGQKSITRVPQATYNDGHIFNTNPTSTLTPVKNRNEFVRTTTKAPSQTTTEKYAYGSGLKGRYNSYDAKQLPQATSKPSQSSSRGSIKYKTKSDYVIVPQVKEQSSGKIFSTPVTTYSPPLKYTLQNNKILNKDDDFDLPPIPKHKSELTQSEAPRNDIQDQTYGEKISFQPISSTAFPPGKIQVNVIQPKNREPAETQVPEESSSFVKNSFNSITDESVKTSSSPYPNHRSTYSDLKELSYLEAPKISSISSITPHLVTTQPLNNGKPFVGSRVGNTALPNQPTTQSKYTYLPTTTASSKPNVIFGVIRHSSTTEPPPYGPPELFNVGSTEKSITNLFNTGSTEKTLPPLETSTPFTTRALPTEIFNVGNTDTTLQADIVPNTISTTTVVPLAINVPEQGSLNLGQQEQKDYQGLNPVNEPPFVKKFVPLLYSDQSTTQRTAVDQATVYGTYPSRTQKPFASSRNTPYSPTVPTVTQSPSSFSANNIARTSKAFNQGVPIKFNNGQDKISVHLSRNVGGQTRSKEVQPSNLRVGAVVHVADAQPLGGSSTTIAPTSDGFFVTRGFNDGFSTAAPSKSKTEKPRPFSKSLEYDERFNTANPIDEEQITSTFPTYHISSARPFELSEITSASPPVTTPADFTIYDNVDNMIGVLQEIAKYNSPKEFSEESRPGLVIPPSAGPQTLHSLAQYFANELQMNGTDNGALEPDTKEKITSLLTAMTVHGYNNLFNVGATATPTAATSVPTTETTTVLTPSRFGSDESKNDSNKTESNSIGADDDLLSTTSLPELRQLARNFSLALSSYLNDPDNFKKSLEGLRPTEPPPLDGSDNAESSTSEDELLNFSDADVKPSTPANPSPTWGYILAAEANKGPQEDVKNSLNPDLNTADSQSFVPRFNNVQADEKQAKAFTDLPLNHWTSSPTATQLWQKALSVNPAVVNEHFETTPSGIAPSGEETTEQELFNPDVLPDLTQPRSEISYDLRELPPLSLNSTQVHGILIDFMNNTKSDEHNRLNRILKKLNTSEDEFLDRMKEIESNPLTKRLILLLISECGANITQDFGLSANNHQRGTLTLKANDELLSSAPSNVEAKNVENHALGQLVHPHLNEEDQDTRALQLLNSLYTIASKFGRKR